MRRLRSAVITLFVVVSFNFFLFRAAPGDAVSSFAVTPLSAQARANLRHEFQLDQPLWRQYLAYLDQLLHGNLGRSFQTAQPVSSILWRDLQNTVPMVLLGTVFAAVMGTLLGTMAAWRRGTFFDRSSVGGALALSALPSQWLGLVGILLFAGVLPTSGRVDDFVSSSGWAHIVDVTRHMILPSATIAVVLLGQYVLLSRAAVLDTLRQDFVLAARAEGNRDRYVLWRRAFPNALLPMTTVFALSMGQVVAGSILVETVFSWPGIGREVYDAVLGRDYPVLEGAFLVLTISVLVCNLCADLLYAKLDPRVSV
ncbi:MAG TPA: ABC transporter permease [Mycobacteriales bacterium]|nr:ABC transporter permease [Mycobacteriales bacterium]